MVNRATSGPASANPSGSVAASLPPSGPTISAVLVEDEKLASDELAYLLKEFADVEVIATWNPTWFSWTCRCQASTAWA